MAYSVTINGKTTDTTSFEAAKNNVKDSVVAFAGRIAQPVRNGLYRSPKTTARINAERVLSARKLAAGVKLPRKAEDVAGNVGGLAFSIVRK